MQAERHGILTPLQDAVLAACFAGDLARDSFALVGGTALAEFYLGHRLSKDLDIFGVDREEVGMLAEDLVERLPRALRGCTVDVRRRGAAFRRLEVSGLSEVGLQVDISLADLPLLDTFQRVDGIAVMGISDLVVGKLMAVCDRIEVRDALDLWALHQEGVDLRQARRQMGAKDPGLAAHPLGLLEMLERLAQSLGHLPWPRTFISVTPEALAQFLRDLAAHFAQDIGMALR